MFETKNVESMLTLKRYPYSFMQYFNVTLHRAYYDADDRSYLNKATRAQMNHREKWKNLRSA